MQKHVHAEFEDEQNFVQGEIKKGNTHVYWVGCWSTIYTTIHMLICPFFFLLACFLYYQILHEHASLHHLRFHCFGTIFLCMLLIFVWSGSMVGWEHTRCSRGKVYIFFTDSCPCVVIGWKKFILHY